MPDQDPPKDGQPGDENWPTYSPPSSQPAPEPPAAPDTPPAETLPPTHVPYGSPQQSYGDYGGTYPPAPGTGGTGVTVIHTDLVSTTSRGCGMAGGIISLVVFIPVVLGMIFGIRAISGGFGEIDDAFSPQPTVDMTTEEGFNEMVAALREETGGTTVFEAGLYGEYGIAGVPVDARSKRVYNYYFNGELRKTSQATSTYKRFDLARIDTSVLPGLFDRAVRLVEDAESTYVLIRAPGENDKGAWFSVYASNAFGESAYFQADETGKVVFEYPVP